MLFNHTYCFIDFFLLSYAFHFLAHCILSRKASSSMFLHLEKFKYQLKETIDVSHDEFLPTNLKIAASATTG